MHTYIYIHVIIHISYIFYSVNQLTFFSASLLYKSLYILFLPKTLKYWVAVPLGQSYLMGRRCLSSLGWPPF